MYNSFAIWYDKEENKEEKDNCVAELHFNLWQFTSRGKWWQFISKGKSSNTDFLDVGLKITDIENVKNIKFFIPLDVGDSGVRDLGGVIESTPHLIQAIFNESYEVHPKPGKKIKVTLKNSKQETFNVYSLDEADISNIKEGNDGTTITISLNGIKVDDDSTVAYLRLRFDLKKSEVQDKIIHTSTPKDGLIKSSVIKEQLIDFRFNEARNLPKKINENIKGQAFLVKKIHFFIIRELTDKLLTYGNGLNEYRVLENDTWRPYVNDHDAPKLNHMIAYHWKKKSKDGGCIKNFIISSKFSYSSSSWIKIFKYLLIGILLGAAGGIAGNLSTDLLTSNDLKTENHISDSIVLKDDN